jgi:hypothetical protein
MILYHFTKDSVIDEILTEGLLPSVDVSNMLGGAEVVWLTERTDTRLTDENSNAIFEQTGVQMKHWLELRDPDHDSHVRLTVRIPSADRKLFKYAPWLRGRTGGLVCRTRTPSGWDIPASTRTGFTSAKSHRRKSLAQHPARKVAVHFKPQW